LDFTNKHIVLDGMKNIKIRKKGVASRAEGGGGVQQADKILQVLTGYSLS
jgi:hypothetical protein